VDPDPAGVEASLDEQLALQNGGEGHTLVAFVLAEKNLSDFSGDL
jgi:hypothetical protein